MKSAAEKLADFQREAAQARGASPWQPKVIQGGNLFASFDWVDLYRKKKSGEIPVLDFNQLKPDEQRFLENLKADCDRMLPADRERIELMVEKFLSGEMSLAEFECYPPELMYEMAKMGQALIDLNRFDDAKIIFEGLAILDHKNYYYRGVLGSIAQRQKDYVTAIAEYSMALLLKADDVPSYTNRGECLMKVGLLDDAVSDFEHAMQLSQQTVDRFANRARVLHRNILQKRKAERV